MDLACGALNGYEIYGQAADEVCDAMAGTIAWLASRVNFPDRQPRSLGHLLLVAMGIQPVRLLVTAVIRRDAAYRIGKHLPWRERDVRAWIDRQAPNVSADPGPSWAGVRIVGGGFVSRLPACLHRSNKSSRLACSCRLSTPCRCGRAGPSVPVGGKGLIVGGDSALEFTSNRDPGAQ